jgi:hypothetical protein
LATSIRRACNERVEVSMLSNQGMRSNACEYCNIKTDRWLDTRYDTFLGTPTTPFAW